MSASSASECGVGAGKGVDLVGMCILQHNWMENINKIRTIYPNM
jgi:hypothetical protein